MKLATIFNQKGERVSYVILKDNEVRGFGKEIRRDNQTMSVVELNNDSLAAALRSCYDDGAFTLANRLFDSVYESSIFLGPSDLSEEVYGIARAIYGGGVINDRLRMTKEAIENFFTNPPMNGS